MFDLLTDPTEHQDLRRSQPVLFESLRKKLLNAGKSIYQTDYAEPGTETCLNGSQAALLYRNVDINGTEKPFLGPMCFSELPPVSPLPATPISAQPHIKAGTLSRLKTDEVAFLPRSYWRFENESCLTNVAACFQDSMGKQKLLPFENDYANEMMLWRTQAQGGIVGAYVDRTGQRNLTGFVTPLDNGNASFLGARMGTVPFNLTSDVPITSSTQAQGVPGLTIEMLIKPKL